MQDRIFYSICFGFIFGVFLRSFVVIDLYLAILLGGITFALILFFSLISKNKWGIIASIFLFVFVLGIWRFHVVDRPAPQVISMEGVIVDEPDIRENNQKLIIQTPRKFAYNTKTLNSTGNNLIETKMSKDCFFVIGPTENSRFVVVGFDIAFKA